MPAVGDVSKRRNRYVDHRIDNCSVVFGYSTRPSSVQLKAVDCLNQKSNRGGKRVGAGRPRGSKEPHTLEREAVLRAYRERVCKVADRLLDAEITVARGCSFLWKKPKTAPKGEPRKAELVKDQATIQRYLDGDLDQDPDDYYFITTERPDTNTIRNMFDRTFDKPAQRTEVSGPDGGPLEIKEIRNLYVAAVSPADASAR